MRHLRESASTLRAFRRSWHVLPTEIERGGQDQRPRPPVDRVEGERLGIAAGVGDEPDDESDECQRCASFDRD
jgi:hypothetical protein